MSKESIEYHIGLLKASCGLGEREKVDYSKLSPKEIAKLWEKRIKKFAADYKAIVEKPK